MTPAVVVLLGLLSSVDSLLPPRISFLLNSTVRPLVHFSLPGVHNTTTLLLSNDGSTLYVGARDAILSLDVSHSDVISLKKKVDWRPMEGDRIRCNNKGKTREVHCSNFVRVLQPINSTHLYACGSYAYNPQDAYVDTERLSVVQRGSAKGRCPFSPFQRSTAISIDGELFTASTSDFRGIQPEIARHFSKDGRPDVAQDSFTSLLEDPEFAGSSLDPVENKLYFFFSEVGKEFSYLSDLRVARVAQVCKDDVGGQRTLQRKWTSFAKSSMVCQVPKQLPFNVLHDVFILQLPDNSGTSHTEFYGVFTSQWSSGPESAVCVFTLQDIRTAFAGSYRTFDSENHLWSPLQGKHSYLGQCGLENATDAELNEVRKSFLTSRGVAPVGNSPVLVSSEQRYSRVTALRTEAADGKQFTVLFLLTDTGFLHKVVLFNGAARIVEEIQVFTEPQLVKNLLLSSSKGVLYVGTSEGVTAVPVANCSVYRSCRQCILARDPLCGWSPGRSACVRLDGPGTLVQDVENGNVTGKCPQQSRVRMDSAETDVRVQWGEAVQLQCEKLSNLARLTWMTPRVSSQKNLFVQSADGSLSFLATNDTFGTYHCVAEEAGYTNVVASYNVQPISPRSVRPHHDVSEEDEYTYTDEDIVTEEPMFSVTTSDAEDFSTATARFKGNLDTRTEGSGLNSVHVDGVDLTPVSQSENEPLGEFRDRKNYFNELVAVSLLLVMCICTLILGGLHMWRQGQTSNKVSPKDGNVNRSLESVPSLSPEDGNVNRSLESVPSLSPEDGNVNRFLESVPSLSPEDADPELKVLQD